VGLDAGKQPGIASHHGSGLQYCKGRRIGVKGALIETISNLAEGSLNLSQVCLCASAGI
jgi:hypothetical protein